MRLTTKARYAVMALVDLASRSEAVPIKLADIAERQEISLSYLEQLFSRLRRAALVRSVRGPGGGYLLARPRETVSIADIVLAVDEPIRATRCKVGTGRGCRKDAGRCQTHDLWDELGNQIYLFLKTVTVADVVEGRVVGMSGLRSAAPLTSLDGVAAE